MARARVAETGQRRRLEGPVTQVFVGSNPSPRIIQQNSDFSIPFDEFKTSRLPSR